MNNLTELLKNNFNTIELKLGAFFVEGGQISKHLGYVESGLLHSYQIDQNGDLITTNFFQPNSFCGSFYSFYKQKPAFEFIQTLTPVRLQVIGFDHLHKLLETDLIMNQIGRKAIEDVCINKDIRISKMLQLDAQSRYAWMLQEYPFVLEKAPLKHIASYLGMKPESLSRIRRQLIS